MKQLKRPIKTIQSRLVNISFIFNKGCKNWYSIFFLYIYIFYFIIKIKETLSFSYWDLLIFSINCLFIRSLANKTLSSSCLRILYKFFNLSKFSLNIFSFTFRIVTCQYIAIVYYKYYYYYIDYLLQKKVHFLP